MDENTYPVDPEDGLDTEISFKGIGSVSFERGNHIYDHDRNKIAEPDVFYIEDIDVIEQHRKQGYGKQLFTLALNKAKSEGFVFSRMTIIHPSVIHIIEELRREGLVQETSYIPTQPWGEPDIPTAETFLSPHRLSAENAEVVVRAFQQDAIIAEREDRDPRLRSVEGIIRL